MPMLSALLRPLIMLIALCALPILAIHAQPYNDSELRAVLTRPEGCPAPCFMGIRPGTTSAEQAIAILDAHQWIEGVGEKFGSMRPEVIDYQLPPMLSMIEWQWNDAAPRRIDAQKSGSLVVVNRLVNAVNIPTHLALGDVLLVYGRPDNDRLIWSHSEQFGQLFQYDAWYTRECMRVTVEGTGLPRGLYHHAVRISFQPQRPDVYDTARTDTGCGT